MAIQRGITNHFGARLVTPLLFLAVAGLVTLLVFVALRDPINEPLVANPAEWQASQPVTVNEPDPPVIGAWEARFPEFAEVINRTEPLLISCPPPKNGGPLELASPTFPAPEYISLLVMGDMHEPGNRVYLERSDNQERFFVRTQAGLRFWQRATYHMPMAWVGQPVRLRATVESSRESRGIGVSNPRALNQSAVLRSQLRALLYLPGYVVALILFLAPGLAASMWYAPKLRCAPMLVIPIALVGSSLLGYSAFWFTLVGPVPHRILAWTVAVLGPIALVWVAKRRWELLCFADVKLPLALWLLVGLFYLAVTFSFDLGKPGAAHTTTRFLDEEISVDAQLPSLFAHEISRSAMKLPAWVLNWRTSDRPPLQAGVALLQRPLIEAAGLAPWALYLPLGVALQCAWVPILWAMLRAMGLSRQRCGIALLVIVFSGFVFVNSVFVWPKMLSAALVLVSVLFAIFHGVAPIGREWAGAVLLGLAAGLAALAHGGALFTLLALGALLLLPAWFPGITRLFIAAAAFSVLWLPWAWYQSLDPPGDRLIKEFIVGATIEEQYTLGADNQVAVDSPFRIGKMAYPEPTPAWRALAAAYDQISLREILENKWANLAVLFVERPSTVGNIHQTIPKESTSIWRGFRRREFFNLFWALGLLNAGWGVFLWAWWRRKTVGVGMGVPSLVAASLVLWLLLMFGPGTTVLDQGPYATFLLIFGLLAAALSMLPRFAIWCLLVAEGVVFTMEWLLTSAVKSYALTNPFMIFLSGVFLLGLLRASVEASRLPKDVSIEIDCTA